MHKEFTDNVKVKNESINCKEVSVVIQQKMSWFALRYLRKAKHKQIYV